MNDEPQRESPVLGLLSSIDSALTSLAASVSDLEDAMKLCLAQEQPETEDKCSATSGNECDLTASLENQLYGIQYADDRIRKLRGRCLL